MRMCAIVQLLAMWHNQCKPTCDLLQLLCKRHHMQLMRYSPASRYLSQANRYLLTQRRCANALYISFKASGTSNDCPCALPSSYYVHGTSDVRAYALHFRSKASGPSNKCPCPIWHSYLVVGASDVRPHALDKSSYMIDKSSYIYDWHHRPQGSHVH
jgi:hypothetical protein